MKVGRSRNTKFARASVGLMALAILALVPVTASAQSVGSISGSVTDSTGGVLPGVTVEAASPALIEGSRIGISDGTGIYRIVDLRPGTYTVTFSLPGFSTVVREGLILNAGITLAISASMAVGSIEETITVTGATPVVDVQNVRGQTTLTSEILRSVPTSTNIQGLARLTLGVTQEGVLGGSDSGGSKGEPVYGFNQVHGSPTGITMIDGMKTSSAYRVPTAHRYLFNSLTAREIIVETSGGDPESESAGVNINLIPREGGNIFSGSVVGEFTNSSLQAENNLNDSLTDRFVTQSNVTEHIYDAGVGIGGPIVADTLWFYGAYRDWGAKESLAGNFRNKIPETLFYEADTDQPAVYDRYQRDASLRLTWQATDKQKLSLSSGVQTYNWIGAYFSFGPPEGHWDFLVFPTTTTWSNGPTRRATRFSTRRPCRCGRTVRRTGCRSPTAPESGARSMTGLTESTAPSAVPQPATPTTAT